MLGSLQYESATIAYDTVSKNYVNPVDGTIYGTTPPTGGWPIIWYADPTTGTPVPVNTTETAAQISADLAAAQVVPTTTPAVTVAPTTGVPVTSWFDGTTFGVSNMVLVGGVVVIGALMFMGKGR